MLLGTISEVVPYLINGILGIIKMNILIRFLGSEMNGYYQFINQIITYLFLMEAGFTAAVSFQMYKPFADQDHQKVKEIYSGSRDIFKKIGWIITGLVAIATIVIPFTVKARGWTLVEIIGTFLLICISYLIPFFGKQNLYEATLSSDQKSYVFSTVFNVLKIINDILIILSVIWSKSLLSIGISILFIKAIEEVIFRIVGRKIYPWLTETEEKDMKALEMTKDVAWNKLGYLIANNVDSVIVMYILGPVSVSIYGSYNYVAGYLSELISRINGIVSLTFGNVFAKGEKKRSYKLFSEYNTLILFLAFACTLTFHFGIRPFIHVWIPEEIYMIRQVDVMMFSMCLFLTILFYPLHSMINANGLYKESKNYIFISAIVNLTLSLLLVKSFDFAGLLGATACSYLVSNYLKGNLVYHKVFEKELWTKKKIEYVFCIILFLVLMLLGHPIETFLLTHCTSFFTCLFGIVITFVIISFVTIMILFLVKKNTRDLVERLLTAINKKKKKEK